MAFKIRHAGDTGQGLHPCESLTDKPQFLPAKCMKRGGVGVVEGGKAAKTRSFEGPGDTNH